MELITTATIFLASMNVYNGNCNFAYESMVCDNVVSTQTVYQKSWNGKYLSKHLKYNYVYDAEQRLAQKEVMKWDISLNKWVKSHCLNYTYNTNGYSIEYAQWNAQHSDYTNIMEKQTYTVTISGTMAVCSYSWDKKESQWVLRDNIIMLKSPEIELYTSQFQQM